MKTGRHYSGAALATALSLALASTASAQSAIPAAYRGQWGRNGDCRTPASRLVIGNGRAALGTGPEAEVVYDADDDGKGHGALHWEAEGDVDDFVLGPTNGSLIHNTQGEGMPGREVFRRCR